MAQKLTDAQRLSRIQHLMRGFGADVKRESKRQKTEAYYRGPTGGRSLKTGGGRSVSDEDKKAKKKNKGGSVKKTKARTRKK